MPGISDLQGYMAALEASFDAERACSRPITVQYLFTGAVNGACHAVLANGALAVAEGIHPAPTVTVTSDFDLWNRIVTYEIDPLMAWQDGLYQAEGDLEALIELDACFRR
jgi:hypothetical protein